MGDYYVLAHDPTEAQEELKKLFDSQDYGISDYRMVTNIKWITEHIGEFNGKPFLSDKTRLLIVNDNQ